MANHGTNRTTIQKERSVKSAINKINNKLVVGDFENEKMGNWEISFK
jgi:hypothetical protein